ncbi:MAG: gliding motility-associated C-terminal domain-containing protein [Lentimicrobiaceae bacterium]|nr:gliding motility-associated C-terminal domain-containing protein [Lentimicrobiaceae bacterium]
MYRIIITVFVLIKAVVGFAQLPPTPVIDSVSIVNGKAVVSWFPNHDSTDGYLIYHLNGASRILIDTVHGITSSSYTDILFDPCIGNQAYCVNAYQGDNVSPDGTLYPIGTLFFRSLSFQQCDKIATLLFNNSEFTYNDIIGYSVFSTEHGKETYLGEATGGIFIHEFDFMQGAPYCYLIRLYRNNGSTSSSCERCFSAQYPPMPSRLGLKLLSVNNNTAELLLTPDQTNPYAQLKILRTEVGTGNTQEMFFTNGWNSELLITDASARTNNYSYIYNVTALDSCGNESNLLTVQAQTMLLTAYSANESTNTLEWNAHTNSQWKVIHYRVRRSIPDRPDTLIILPATTTNYNDIVLQYAHLGLSFTYVIEAECVPDVLNSNPDTVISFSNPVTLVQTPYFTIPNAFTPDGDGLNDIFHPVPAEVFQFSTFTFTIFDRLGKQIYSTHNQNEGWNGDGYPMGIYFYNIVFKLFSGKSYEKRGVITLIR